jgi:hypothetical protein
MKAPYTQSTGLGLAVRWTGAESPAPTAHMISTIDSALSLTVSQRQPNSIVSSKCSPSASSV